MLSIPSAWSISRRSRICAESRPQLHGIAHRRAHHAGRAGRQRERDQETIPHWPRRSTKLPARRFATWRRSAEIFASARAAGISATALACCPRDESGKDLVAEGDNRYHAILGNDGPAKFVSPSTIVPVLIAYGAKIRLDRSEGQARASAREVLRDPEDRKRTRARSAAERNRHRK